jgi:hypothetical protein
MASPMACRVSMACSNWSMGAGVGQGDGGVRGQQPARGLDFARAAMIRARAGQPAVEGDQGGPEPGDPLGSTARCSPSAAPTPKAGAPRAPRGLPTRVTAPGAGWRPGRSRRRRPAAHCHLVNRRAGGSFPHSADMGATSQTELTGSSAVTGVLSGGVRRLVRRRKPWSARGCIHGHGCGLVGVRMAWVVR